MENQEQKKRNPKPVVGITLGDVNGIGPEIIIKALKDNRLLRYITPVIYGSTKILSYYRKSLQANDFNYSQVKDNFFNFKKINVVNCWNDMVEINPGTVDETTGKYTLMALERGTRDLVEEKIDALVTGPVNKKLIHGDDFDFSGQTEYIASRSGEKDSLMMMVSETLKVGLVTTHIPIREVADEITSERLRSKINIFLKSLKKDFAINKPRLAVLGLNPHAGEEGLIGEEEKEVISPVIEEFKNKGHLVYGPYPSDGFFGVGQYRNFDGVLAMYHDQGLTAFKSISFEEGVNYTAGLKVIRTSPDHGTAYNLAGKNSASEISMRSALYLAREIYQNRYPEPL